MDCRAENCGRTQACHEPAVELKTVEQIRCIVLLGMAERRSYGKRPDPEHTRDGSIDATQLVVHPFEPSDLHLHLLLANDRALGHCPPHLPASLDWLPLRLGGRDDEICRHCPA